MEENDDDAVGLPPAHVLVLPRVVNLHDAPRQARQAVPRLLGVRRARLLADARGALRRRDRVATVEEIRKVLSTNAAYATEQNDLVVTFKRELLATMQPAPESTSANGATYRDLLVHDTRKVS